MRVAVTGTSGFIGSNLVPHLEAAGHDVVRMVRPGSSSKGILWDWPSGTIDAEGLRGVDAVVHLAGEGVASGRWTPDRKARIRDSRLHGTRMITHTIANLAGGPRVLVSGSAVGYYGDRGDEILQEESGPGAGFLADLCREWEGATREAEQAGIRVVHVRTGIVTDPSGGILGKQWPLFKLGLGTTLGTGRQWTSWISLRDELRALEFVLGADELAGPVNLTAPNPVTAEQYTTSVARAIGRPAFLKVPVAALAAPLGGELAREMTASQRVLPARLELHGFTFEDAELEPAVRRMVG